MLAGYNVCYKPLAEPMAYDDAVAACREFNNSNLVSTTELIRSASAPAPHSEEQSLACKGRTKGKLLRWHVRLKPRPSSCDLDI